jgi:hypothetical protein
MVKGSRRSEMKRPLIGVLLAFLLASFAQGTDITMRQKMPLRKATHIDYDLADWDTVFVNIIDSTGATVVETVGLSSNGKGRWGGTWTPVAPGSYVAEYNAVYSGDTIVEEEYFTVLDTVAFHGGAAGLTAEDIWTYPTRTLTSGTGTGANDVIVRVKSATDSAVIPKATVALWNADESALMGLLSSDTDSGKAEFAQDNGTYKLRIHAYKFQWDVPITLVVSGNTDTTVYATEFTPSPPPSADLVTVYGYIDSIGLAGIRAKITCTIHAQNLRYGSLLLAYHSYTKTVFTDIHGYWEMFLYANDDLTPAGTMYHFTITSPYMQTLERRVKVPEGVASWEFTY